MATVFPGALDTFAANKVADLEDALKAVENHILSRPSLDVDPKWYGAIADGLSHPLSAVVPGRSLAAWQALYPHVTSTANEMDWVAAQAAANTGALVVRYSGHYVINRQIRPLDGQTHEVFGTIENIANRYVAPDAYEAACFELGNMHPAAMNPAATGYAWAVYGLNAITAGATTVTVTTPAGATRPINPGDIVVIRSENNSGAPTPPALPITYDFAMWNRVVSWNASTGALKLELPVPVTIAASGSTTTLHGPKLVVNDGSDIPRGLPWRVSQRVTIRARKLIGIAPVHSRSAGWRCVIDVEEADCDHLISANAMALSEINVRGRFQERALEAKQFCHGSTFRLRGTYKHSSAVSPKPAVSIGEQCYDCDFDADVEIGSDFTVSQRAVEIWSPDIRFRGRVRHNGSGGHTEDWAVKSTLHLARPPSGIELDLVVRTRLGKTQFGVIGNGTAPEGDPRKVRMRLDQESEVATTYAARIARGTDLHMDSCIGSAIQVNSVSPGELPEEAKLFLYTANGTTYAANSEVRVPGSGTIAIRGPKTGDIVKCGLELASGGAVTAGAFGALQCSWGFDADGVGALWVRNRSAVAVTTTGAPAIRFLVSWEKVRL